MWPWPWPCWRYWQPLPLLPGRSAWTGRMAVADLLIWLQGLFMIAGCLFFTIGTLGLFRLSETRDRLHALTKVDNLGLGLIALALLPSAPTAGDAVKILLVWLVVLMASGASAHLIARAAGRTPEPEDS